MFYPVLFTEKIKKWLREEKKNADVLKNVY